MRGNCAITEELLQKIEVLPPAEDIMYDVSPFPPNYTLWSYAQVKIFMDKDDVVQQVGADYAGKF